MKSINPDVYTSAGYTLKTDGRIGSIVGKPAYNVMLNYYNGDYKAINGAVGMDAGVDVTLGSAYRPLYNGNISSMAVNIEKLNNPILYNYQYDQLNRLVAMDAWRKTGSNWSNIDTMSDFQERISYDPNGNILGYKRNGNKTFASKPLGMDSLTYKYVMGTNKLDHVLDSVPASNYDIDIDQQTAGNYLYDSIGNLIKDNAEGINKISWTVYGKISLIIKSDTTISYTYDASGNRISKTVIKSGSTDTARTWYVRDAQGNVMSVYTSGNDSVNEGRLSQTELHVYSSSRLGLLKRSFDVASDYNPADTTMPLLGTGYSINFGRGYKLFELSNHLRNVLVTLNDKKLGISTNNSTVDYFIPQVTSAQDYYPFGMLQPGRSYNAGGYSYGFNGKENDNEVKGEGNQQDYGMRFYDPRLGKFLSVDPLARSYSYYTPYQFAGNNPVSFIDLDGGEPEWAMLKLIHWVEQQSRKEVVTENTTNQYALFGFGFLHGLASSVDVIGTGEDVIDIFRRNNSNGNKIDLFTTCMTGDCALAELILVAAGPEYGVVKMIDEKINKAIHGDSYDRGEITAEVLLILIPLLEETKGIKWGVSAAKVARNSKMTLAVAVERAGIAAEETTHAESYLLKALKRQGFNEGDLIPSGLKESWVEGGYKYEVRVHEANSNYSHKKDIFRVARQKLDQNGNAAGTGLEYLDENGVWHPQSTLKPGGKKGSQPNPNYNKRAAEETHIEKPEKIE
jgi:RHS repeat-associated protein